MPHNNSSSVAKLPVFVFFRHLHLPEQHCNISWSTWWQLAYTRPKLLLEEISSTSCRVPCESLQSWLSLSFTLTPPYREVWFALKLATVTFILHSLHSYQEKGFPLFRWLSISVQSIMSILFGVACFSWSPSSVSVPQMRVWKGAGIPSVCKAALHCYGARTESRGWGSGTNFLDEFKFANTYKSYIYVRIYKYIYVIYNYTVILCYTILYVANNHPVPSDLLSLHFHQAELQLASQTATWQTRAGRHDHGPV